MFIKCVLNKNYKHIKRGEKEMLSEKYKNILIVSSIIMGIIIISLVGYLGINKIRLNNRMKEAKIFAEDFSNLISSEQTEITYKESKVAGIIEIPRISLKVPILEETQTDTEEAAGILTGVGLNNVGNTVIVGQSYYKNTAFHDIEKLNIEDEIYITDVNGLKKTYTINNIYKTNKEDKKYITENSKGNTKITLITNTEGEILVIQANAD